MNSDDNYQRVAETELADSSKSEVNKKNSNEYHSKTALLKLKAPINNDYDNFSEMVIGLYAQGAELEREMEC